MQEAEGFPRVPECEGGRESAVQFLRFSELRRAEGEREGAAQFLRVSEAGRERGRAGESSTVSEIF